MCKRQGHTAGGVHGSAGGSSCGGERRPRAEGSITNAFKYESAARQYLGSASSVLTPEGLLPARKWVQLLYLMNAGELKVSAQHIARFLDVPGAIARSAVDHLSAMSGTNVMAAIAEKISSDAGRT